ncbi:MAG: hypothetical protein KUG56_06555 [Kordiimonadaceae bacterium]|nr:hypothetical protein [Kordiimonadaceae bacterium]
MALLFPHKPNAAATARPPYDTIIPALRASLLHALRSAVETGDAPTATHLFRAVAGHRAVQRLAPQGTMEQLRRWLAQEP